MLSFLVVIVLFSVVQSMFGVGLLVFGTPSLLLLGYSFPETLSGLLPASLAISALQLLKGPRIEPVFVGQFALWCILPLVAALALVLTVRWEGSLNLLVAAVLAAFVVLRSVPALGERTRGWVARHQRPWLVVMGTVHGLSNLGGGLLTVFAASRYRDKEQIRKLIAFCYFCFAATQLGVLVVLVPNTLYWEQLAYAAVSSMVFLGVGQFVFTRVPMSTFDRLFTVLIASYSVLLVLSGLGIV